MIVVLQLAVLCGAAVISAAAQNKTTDFSGMWVLDKTKTQHLPATLESYSMEIRQYTEQLTYTAELKGEIFELGMRFNF